MSQSTNINDLESTLTHIRVVQGSNFNNTVHSFDDNGDGNIGGQHVGGRQKVNTADNKTIFDANARNGYIKFATVEGKTIAVLDCRPESTGFYVAVPIRDGYTSESLDKLFPSD